MNNAFLRTQPLTAIGLLLAGSSVFADGTRFDDFTPLSNSAGPTADEAMPITFGNPDFTQESIADRSTQLTADKPNTGNWDMNTLNETGRQKGRYLFTVFETGSAGVQRHDRRTGETETIWQSPSTTSPTNHVAFDPSFWTPWGTFITAEESWVETAGGSASPYGRLFELVGSVHGRRPGPPPSYARNICCHSWTGLPIMC